MINYRGRKQMKVNQFRLAKPEDGFKTQDFVLWCTFISDEIQENISHYILDIENANLQRITRHLLKNIKINSLRILRQVHTIIILQVD